MLTKEEVYTVPEKCMEVQKDLETVSEVLSGLYESWEQMLLTANK